MALMTVLRRLCLWLVMLALPLQGLAAASMIHCGSQSPQRMEAAHAVDHDGAQGMSGHVGHEHALQHAASSGTDGQGHDASSDTHRCLVCAFCCHSVALNEAPLPLTFGEAAQTSAPEPSVLIQPMPVLVPDKPPRI